MATIKDKTGKVVSDAVVLRQYFGFQEGQNLSGFMTEIKALTPTDKEELAVGAAKELGYSVE